VDIINMPNYPERWLIPIKEIRQHLKGVRIKDWDRKKNVIIERELESKEINKLIWTNWNHTLTPTAYTIDVSTNKIDWTTVKKIENGAEVIITEKKGPILIVDLAISRKNRKS